MPVGIKYKSLPEMGYDPMVRVGLMDAMAKLVEELTPGTGQKWKERGIGWLYEIERHSHTHHLLLAFNQKEQLVGMCLLLIFPLVDGTEARLENFVVLESERDKGIGTHMLEILIDKARTRSSAEWIELSSGDHRVPAHSIYKKLGLKEKKSKVFELDFEPVRR